MPELFNIGKRAMGAAALIGAHKPKDLQASRGLDSKSRRNMAEFLQVFEYYEPSRNRAIDNTNVYWGVDGSQWPRDALEQLLKELRHPSTYNVAQQKVDGLAGAILANPFDLDFLPVEGEVNWATKLLKQSMHADKELMDWNAEFRQALLDALIFEGWEEIYISDRYKPDLRIGFARHIPGRIFPDPSWKTNNRYDLEFLYKVSYLSGIQILDIFKNNKQKIVSAALSIKEVAKEETEGNADVDFRSPNQGVFVDPRTHRKFLGKYMVVEKYVMKDIEKTFEFDPRSGKALPDTDDMAFKMAWLNQNSPGWQDHLGTEQGLRQESVTEKICFVETQCPELCGEQMLEDAVHPVQIKSVPFFLLSASRMNGESRGIMDIIKDAQRTINYRESMLTYMIQTQASTPVIADPMLFGSNQGKMDAFEKNRNNPAYTAWTEPGMLNRFKPEIMQRGQVSGEVVQQINRMWDVIDRISKQPAAASARSEKSGESGVLFAQKLRVSEIANLYLTLQIKQHWNDKGEAYFFLFKDLYGDDVERNMKVFSENNSFKINERVVMPDGSVEFKNRVADVQRHKVMVSESPTGENRRLEVMSFSADMLKNLPPDNLASRQIFQEAMLANIDFLSDEKKKELEDAAVLEKEQAIATLKANTATMNLTTANAEAQLQQLQGQTTPQATPPESLPAPVPVPQISDANLQAPGPENTRITNINTQSEEATPPAASIPEPPLPVTPGPA